MNRIKHIVVVIVLLLVLMPAAVYADDDSGDMVASEATETMEDVSETEEKSDPADIQAEPDDASEEETVETPEPVINEDSGLDPDEDDWSDVSDWSEGEPEPPVPLPEADEEDETPCYAIAAVRVKASVAEKREFVDVSDLGLDDEDCLFDAFYEEGAIDSTVDEISIVWDNDIITSVLLHYEKEDEYIPVETVSTYQPSDAVMDVVEIEETPDKEASTTDPVKSEEVPDEPAEDGLSTWLALTIGAAAGLLKMMMGGAL
jgi:hypothetical protein